MKSSLKLVATLALAVSFATAAGQGASPTIGGSVLGSGIFAGISPDTGKALYTTQQDAPGPYAWHRAAEYCAELGADGRHDWRVPAKGELNLLFQNQAAIAGFRETSSDDPGWYWSATQADEGYYGAAWAERSRDRLQYYFHKGYALSLRCVRG